MRLDSVFMGIDTLCNRIFSYRDRGRIATLEEVAGELRHLTNTTLRFGRTHHRNPQSIFSRSGWSSGRLIVLIGHIGQFGVRIALVLEASNL